MPNTSERHESRHLRITAPSDWVVRFAPLIRAGGTALDVAAGGGRHVRVLRERSLKVVAVDRTVAPLATFGDDADVELIEADLEGGAPWPLAGRRFDGIVVCNYLYRPLFEPLLQSLAPGGVLIYETFARGNEAFSKPRNPDHLLKAGELLELARGRLQVVAYEHGRLDTGELPGIKQRLCAVNDLAPSPRDDGEPEPHPLFP
jgi:SAM-dependent methyltransferase